MNNRIVLDNSCTKEVEFFQVGNLKTRWFLDFCQIFFLTKKKFQLDLQWRPMPTKWHLAKLSMSLSSISRKKMSFKNICFKIDKKSLDHQHVEFDKWIALTQDCIRFLLEISVIDNDCQLYEMMPPSYRVPQKKNHNMYASYFAHFCHLCIFTKKKNTTIAKQNCEI